MRLVVVRPQEASVESPQKPMPLSHRAAVVAAAALTLAVAACGSPSGPGTSLVAAQPTGPSNNSTFSFYNQPVTLTVKTGAATGGATLVTTIEVATDAAFTTMVATQTLAAGQTAITLDHLAAATTYYWRIKTTAGDNAGIFATPASFSIGPALVIQPPLIVQPVADTFPHKRPMFTVTNAMHTGPDATLTYRFDVAADAAFSGVIASGTVPEGPGQTTFVPTADLTPGATYYWHAQASDTMKGVNGGYSSPQPFTTVFPDDGTYRYTLNVNVTPPGCYAPWTFDNVLAVSGSALRFKAPAYFPSDPGLVVNLQRSGEQLSGTLSGGATYAELPTVAVFSGSDYSDLSSPAVTTGTADNAGHFAGRFNGGAYYSTFSLVSRYCLHSTIDWSLTPH